MKPQNEVERNSDFIKLESEVDVPVLFFLAALKNAFGEKVSRGIFEPGKLSTKLENKMQLEGHI